MVKMTVQAPVQESLREAPEELESLLEEPGLRLRWPR